MPTSSCPGILSPLGSPNTFVPTHALLVCSPSAPPTGRPLARRPAWRGPRAPRPHRLFLLAALQAADHQVSVEHGLETARALRPAVAQGLRAAVGAPVAHRAERARAQPPGAAVDAVDANHAGPAVAPRPPAMPPPVLGPGPPGRPRTAPRQPARAPGSSPPAPTDAPSARRRRRGLRSSAEGGGAGGRGGRGLGRGRRATEQHGASPAPWGGPAASGGACVGARQGAELARAIGGCGRRPERPSACQDWELRGPVGLLSYPPPSISMALLPLRLAGWSSNSHDLVQPISRYPTIQAKSICHEVRHTNLPDAPIPIHPKLQIYTSKGTIYS